VTVVVERTSNLAAPPDEVWRHATSMAGVNAELAPISMSFPTAYADLADLPAGALGTELFTSVLRVGPVPFDRHRLTLTEVGPGRSFQEDSRSLLNRRWRHRRTVTPTEIGCQLTDRLEVDPRVPGAGPLTRWLVGRIFDRRHRYLVAAFGRG
jgi:ligand-binding SRPBCC domain-containing protein